MRAVILAGGFGSRIGEDGSARPKPMIEIGEKPILWHLMKIYSAHGINDFIICLGDRGYLVKEYFANYFLHTANVTIDMRDNSMEIHQKWAEPWKVTLLDTGGATMTGGRLKAVKPYLQNDEAFCFTYGDGVADIDVTALIAFHRAHGKLATITAVTPAGRFDALEFDGHLVTNFAEKPAGDGGLINGGFFVLHPSVLNLIVGPETNWEQEPLDRLARDHQLVAFRHDGFWQPMDTLRDRQHLEQLWEKGAPWKVW